MLTIYPWQETQWQRLSAAIAKKKIPHAMLLTGPEGIGLKHFAYCLSAALLCHNRKENGGACGECKSCILLEAGSHPDLLKIGPEEEGEQIKVDMIKKLIDYVYLSSQYAHHKIAIIGPAEAMNRNTANSLLKTLEEPPPDSILILASHKAGLIPATIRSRCQKIVFPPAKHVIAKEWLLANEILDKGTGLDDLIRISQGAPLKVFELLENDPVAKQQVILSDMLIILARNHDPVKLAEKWLAYGPAQVMMWLMMFFLQMSRLKLGFTSRYTEKAMISRHLQELTNELDLTQLVGCYDLAVKNYYAIMGPISLNKQGLLEDMIIFWQSLKQ